MLIDDTKEIYAGNTAITKIYNGTSVVYEKGKKTITSLGISNGQYIDTGIVPDVSTKVEMKIKLVPRAIPSTKYDNIRFTQVPFGQRTSWRQNEFAFWVDYAGSNWQSAGGSGSVIYSMASTNNVNALSSYPAWNKDCIITEQYGKFTLTYDDTLYTYNMSTSGTIYYTNAFTLWLFNLHCPNDPQTTWVNGDWYYTKIWKGGALVRDFVPAFDDNNVPCMYDNVSETYFYNQGTGTFTYG